MKVFVVVISLATLASCATIARPGDVVIAPTETVEVYKTVSQKCIDKMPVMPELSRVPAEGVDQQALARIRREQALILYVNEMRVIMAPCIKEQK